MRRSGGYGGPYYDPFTGSQDPNDRYPDLPLPAPPPPRREPARQPPPPPEPTTKK